MEPCGNDHMLALKVEANTSPVLAAILYDAAGTLTEGLTSPTLLLGQARHTPFSPSSSCWETSGKHAVNAPCCREHTLRLPSDYLMGLHHGCLWNGMGTESTGPNGHGLLLTSEISPDLREFFGACWRDRELSRNET